MGIYTGSVREKSTAREWGLPDYLILIIGVGEFIISLYIY